MILERYFRPSYQSFCVEPVATVLSRQSVITPNGVSIFAGLLGPCIAFSLWAQNSWLAVLLILFSGYLDTLDGTLARLTQKASSSGAAIDIFSDRVVELSIILGLYAYAPEARGFLCLAMLGSSLLCITSFLVVGIFEANASQKSFYYSPGLMERAEAFVFFLLMIVLPVLFAPLAWVYTVLVLWTACLRLWQFCRQHSLVEY